MPVLTQSIHTKNFKFAVRKLNFVIAHKISICQTVECIICIPDSNVHGANMGPMLAPWALLSKIIIIYIR